MAIQLQPPEINTYHCHCTSLLLASTHILSKLPRRSSTTGGLDSALILPLPSSPPDFSQPDDVADESPEEQAQEEQQDMPPEGYTLTLGMGRDSRPVIVRREDGFEKRLLWRCIRCRLVVGYELQGQQRGGERMDVDGEERRKGKEKEGYQGRVIYLLPAGVVSTDVMAGKHGGRKIREEDVDIKTASTAIFD